MKTRYLFLGVAGVTVLLAGCAMMDRKPPLQPAPSVDLARYVGAWHVIACTNNPLERKFADAVETYWLDGTDKIGGRFAWREGSLTAPQKTHDFTARVVDRKTNAIWKVKLIAPFEANYVILAIGKNYDWVVVGHPSRKYGWVMARDTTLPQSTYRKAMEVLRANGYDPSIFIKLKQQPTK